MFEARGGKKKRPNEIMNPPPAGQRRQGSCESAEPFNKPDFLSKLGSKIKRTQR